VNRTYHFEPGDIIVAHRFLYRHYGVYLGNGRVIRYAAKKGDFGADAKVHETSLGKFANGSKCEAISSTENPKGAKPFSRQETVSRARSRIGEGLYNLLFNNCEHFALWCRYGTNKSVQVEKAFAAAIVLGTAIVAAKLIKSERGKQDRLQSFYHI